MNLHVNETTIDRLNIHDEYNIEDIDIVYAAWWIVCEVYAAIKNHTTDQVYNCDSEDMLVINNLREALNYLIVHTGSKAAIKTVSVLHSWIIVERLGECRTALFDEMTELLKENSKTMPTPTLDYCNKVFSYAIARTR